MSHEIPQQAQYYEFSRSEMLPFVPETARLCLEVGCGGGKFGAQLIEKRGATVYGIEPVAEAAERARARLTGCYNILFTAEQIPEDLKAMRFDCIIFNDVLEHLVDPWSALQLCKTLLAPDGCIVASIPNILYFHAFFKMFLSQDWKYEDGGIFDQTHMRFYTKKSIMRLFADCGYKLDTITGIHATDSKKMLLWNLLTFFRFSDMRYTQFAVRARL